MSFYVIPKKNLTYHFNKEDFSITPTFYEYIILNCETQFTFKALLANYETLIWKIKIKHKSFKLISMNVESNFSELSDEILILSDAEFISRTC